MQCGMELDTLIAKKIFGWKFVQPHAPPENRLEINQHPLYPHWHSEPTGFHWHNEPLCYGHNIVDAWKVVDTLVKRGWFVSVVSDPSGNRVCIEKENHLHDYISADTVPLAICLAALMVIE